MYESPPPLGVFARPTRRPTSKRRCTCSRTVRTIRKRERPDPFSPTGLEGARARRRRCRIVRGRTCKEKKSFFLIRLRYLCVKYVNIRYLRVYNRVIHLSLASITEEGGGGKLIPRKNLKGQYCPPFDVWYRFNFFLNKTNSEL